MCPEGGSSRVLGSWLLREGLGVSLSWVRRDERKQKHRELGPEVGSWGVWELAPEGGALGASGVGS